MTTKEQAERIIAQLREKGFTEDEITAAVVDLLKTMNT
jgi:hypothetical protein